MASSSSQTVAAGGFSDTPSADLNSKVFATVKDLSNDQRKHLYDEFGLWEMGYSIGVLNYTLTLAVLLRYPQYFWIVHLIKAFVYLPWRWVRFRKRNIEWLLADFCYFNTYLGVIGCALSFVRITTGYVSPLHAYNYELIRGGFAFANGALLLSIPLYGNKLVFHEVDNTTSVYIHLSPALMFWTLRWGGGFGTSLVEKAWPTMFEVCHDMDTGDTAFASISSMLWDTGPCQANLSEFLTYPAICWIVTWGIPYYIVVFCFLRSWLERNQKITLYTYTIEDTKGNGRLLLKLPESLQPIGYMVQHFTFTVVTGFLSIALWNSFALHTSFLALIMIFAVHNGSTFMFRVVAARQIQGLVAEAAASPSPAPYASLSQEA